MNRPEFELIDWIRAQVRDRLPITLGIGDDAACILPSPGLETLVAADMLMEGVHFTFPPATPQLAGRKSLAVNLSDIAAMGGRATAVFVSVALPKTRGMDFAKDVHTGILELANEFNVVLAGGDTNSWDGPLVINVTVIGEPLGQKPILRQGAKAGDWLFVTGSLGGSLPSGRHLTFSPRLAEAEQLLKIVTLHAMIDISDGLAADLHHVLKASQVGAIVDASRIPLTDIAKVANDARTPLQHGLADGEDFELLFTVSPEDGQKLASEWSGPTLITCIGQITKEPGCWLRYSDGQTAPLPPIGWTHEFSRDQNGFDQMIAKD